MYIGWETERLAREDSCVPSCICMELCCLFMHVHISATVKSKKIPDGSTAPLFGPALCGVERKDLYSSQFNG